MQSGVAVQARGPRWPAGPCRLLPPQLASRPCVAEHKAQALPPSLGVKVQNSNLKTSATHHFFLPRQVLRLKFIITIS